MIGRGPCALITSKEPALSVQAHIIPSAAATCAFAIKADGFPNRRSPSGDALHSNHLP